jgi:hypothetical protein
LEGLVVVKSDLTAVHAEKQAARSLPKLGAIADARLEFKRAKTQKKHMDAAGEEISERDEVMAVCGSATGQGFSTWVNTCFGFAGIRSTLFLFISIVAAMGIMYSNKELQPHTGDTTFDHLYEATVEPIMHYLDTEQGHDVIEVYTVLVYGSNVAAYL